MAWTPLIFGFKSQLTSLKMNQLQANFGAITDGDAGAPRLQRDAIPTGLGADQLRTATASLSGSLSSAQQLNIELNAYSFFPNFSQSARSAYTDTIVLGLSSVPVTSNQHDSPRLSLQNFSGGSSNDYDVTYRYVEE